MILTVILDIDSTSYVCRTFKDESISITKVVSSIKNLGSQGTITKDSFRLPLDGDLLLALGDITNPSIEANVNLNKSIKGRLLIDGFERFRGSFFVTNAVEGVRGKEVELLFQGNETDLKASLSNITMAELFDGETLLYNYTEIKQYYDNPTTYRDTNGYLFPLVDYGKRYTSDPNATEGTIISTLYEGDFKAAVTIEKCLELMPYDITINGADRLLKQAILLHNNKSSIPVLDTSDLDNTGYMESNVKYTTTSNANFKIPFQLESHYSVDNIDLTTDEYVIPVTGEYTFRVEGDITLHNTTGAFVVYAFNMFAIDSIAPASIQVLSQSSGINATSTKTVSVLFSFTNTYTAGDKVSLNIVSSADQTDIESGFKFGVVQSPAFTATSNIDIPANCPDITAWDIFRTIAIQCNGQITTNADGSYTVDPWIDWIEDSTETYFLDNILESKKDVQVKPFSVDGAKSIKLSYKKNEDFYNKQYEELENKQFGTKHIIDTGTEYAKNELAIEAPLSVVPSVPIEYSQAVIPKLFDKDYKTIKGNAVLLQTGSDSMIIQFTLGSLFSGSTTAYNTLPFIGNWSLKGGGFAENDNNFGQSLSYWTSQDYPNNNLYELYWKQYLFETYSEGSRQLIANVRLSINQVDSLNFNEKFFYQGSQFRLTELNGINLTQEGFIQATFMKRVQRFNIDIAPFYPYNVIDSIVQWKDSTDNSDLGDANSESASDVESSAIAYGFYYDSNRNIATQTGQILIT